MTLHDSILKLGKEVEFEGGQKIAFQHAAITNVYVLQDGVMEITFHTPQKGHMDVGHVDKPGAVVGMSLLSRSGRHNSEIRAVTHLRCLQFHVDDLKAAFEQSPELKQNFIDFSRESLRKRFDVLLHTLPRPEPLKLFMDKLKATPLSLQDESPIDDEMFVLNAARAMKIAQTNQDELLAVEYLIFNYAPELSTYSKLHQVPILMQTAETTELGFHILDELTTNGEGIEAELARLCVHLLYRHKHENQFYLTQKQLYTEITNAPDDASLEEIESICAGYLNEMMDHVDLVIEGEENLPDTPGHIFIYNHFANDEYYLIPENYQISLDSNFISCCLLYKKYGSLGTRVVRISESREFAHQNFYTKFDFLFVASHPTDILSLTPEGKRQKRREFYDQAIDILASGKNFVISPEGNSYPMEESPGPLKAGAFTIALKAKVEPYIVPIALADFDKRINDTTLKCRVLEPFKVSEFIQDPDDKVAMRQFLLDYRERFAKDIQNLRGQ